MVEKIFLLSVASPESVTLKRYNKNGGGDGMPVVYLDVLIVVNWVIDTLLLSAVARVLHLPAKRWRVVTAGLIGALGGALLFLITWPTVVVILLHAMLAGTMSVVSFSYINVRSFFKTMLVLYVVSALLSGLVTLLWHMTYSERFFAHNGVIYMDVSPLWLAIAAALSYGITCVYEYATRKRAPRTHIFSLYIDDGGGTCCCTALYDTGMHLREPFSKKAVVLVQRDVLEPYLSDSIRNALLGEIADNRVRMIPYKTLGSEGLLPAFLPKALAIAVVGEEPQTVTNTYVALCKDIGRGEFKALIGSDTIGGMPR